MFNFLKTLDKDKEYIRHKTILCNIRLDILSTLGTYKRETKRVKEWINGLKDNLKEVEKCHNPKEIKDYRKEIEEVSEIISHFGLERHRTFCPGEKRHIVYRGE